MQSKLCLLEFLRKLIASSSSHGSTGLHPKMGSISRPCLQVEKVGSDFGGGVIAGVIGVLRYFTEINTFFKVLRRSSAFYY
jgi:hypothetical protein